MFSAQPKKLGVFDFCGDETGGLGLSAIAVAIVEGNSFLTLRGILFPSQNLVTCLAVQRGTKYKTGVADCCCSEEFRCD